MVTLCAVNCHLDLVKPYIQCFFMSMDRDQKGDLKVPFKWRFLTLGALIVKVQCTVKHDGQML